MSLLSIRERKLGSCGASWPTPRITQPVRSRPTSTGQWHASKMARSRSHDVFLYATQYGYSVASTSNSDQKTFKIFRDLDGPWWEKGCFAAPWVELRCLFSESQSSSSEMRCRHGTPKMNSWRFFEGSSTSAIVRRQRPAPGQVMTASPNLNRLHLFRLLVNELRSYNHVQGDGMRDSNPTSSCCFARVVIPCQVQQPETAPPSEWKRSFFPLLFLPLLIEEQRWNLEL